MIFGFGVWDLDLGFGIWGLGFGIWIWGLGFGIGIWNFEFGMWDLEFRIWDLKFGIWDLLILQSFSWKVSLSFINVLARNLEIGNFQNLLVPVRAQPVLARAQPVPKPVLRPESLFFGRCNFPV